MADPLRFVIIGSGNIAGTYIQALRNVPGVRLVGVVSRSGRRPQRLPPDAEVEMSTSLRAMRTPFDAVVVALSTACTTRESRKPPPWAGTCSRRSRWKSPWKRQTAASRRAAGPASRWACASSAG